MAARRGLSEVGLIAYPPTTSTKIIKGFNHVFLYDTSRYHLSSGMNPDFVDRLSFCPSRRRLLEAVLCIVNTVDEASSSLITEPSDAWEDIPTIEELKEAFKRKTRSPQEEGSEIYGNGNWKFVIIFFNF